MASHRDALAAYGGADIAHDGATMKRTLTRRIDWLDDRLAAATLGRRRERPALLAFVFHGVYESALEIGAETVWPTQPLLVRELSRFLEYFLASGYRFVAPADILRGLDPSGYYALLTFDDGYANNRRALPILRASSVPATFFISARHVAEGRAFWWDVVYRERRRRGVSMAIIEREIRSLKRRAAADIDSYLKRNFGASALEPVGDTDRPFTTRELSDFAADPLVTLGNHTADHVDLTHQTAATTAAEIAECQSFLRELTGTVPEILAYPNGWYDERSIAAARALGISLAVTVGHQKTRLPLTGNASMRIARAFIACGETFDAACARSRSDVRLRRWLESASAWR